MSSSPSPIDLLARQLNQVLHAGLAVSDDGSLYLQLGDGMGVVVSPSPDGQDVVFHAALAMLGRADDGALMAAALSFNLHQAQTRGGAIGLDVDAQLLVFSWRLPAVALVDADALLDCLSQFCATAQELTQGLEEAESQFRQFGLPSDEAGSAARRQEWTAAYVRG